MKMPNRERLDWSLIVFILPIGIILILIVGQIAIRMVPQWSVNAGMESNLDPNSEYVKPLSLLQPLLPQILTPVAWAENYLTPMGDITFPQFFIIEPSSTPSPQPTESTDTPPPPTVTETPLPTVTTPPPTSSSTPPVDTDTPEPTEPSETCDDPAATNFGGPLPCTYPPTTCQDPAATNFGGPLPCTYPPTTCQDPAATNFGGPLPCTYPPTTCQDPAATNFGGPLPCTYPPTICEDPEATNFGGPLPCTYPPPILSTIDPSDYLPVDPPPAGVGTDPDNLAGPIDEGTYIFINIGVTVEDSPDANYDLVFYEYNYNGVAILLDWIIIGLTDDTDPSDGIQSYYEVFNWGQDGSNISGPDNNTNIGDIAGAENDNQEISTTELYDPDGGSSYNQTGILIDVDNATSNPPPNTYNVVIISPIGNGDPAQVDAIATVEVPINSPPPPPVQELSVEEGNSPPEPEPIDSPVPSDAEMPAPEPEGESPPPTSESEVPLLTP